MSATTLCRLGIDKTSIRTFGNVTQFLGKVGPNIFIEVAEHSCIFRSLTDSNQSFGCCKLDREFFNLYESPSNTIRCKLPVKCFIAAFKNLKNVTDMELTFMKGRVESVLVFKLQSIMGIVKNYKFCIEECDIMEALFDTRLAVNKLVCGSQKLSGIFTHMHGSVEVAMQLGTQHLRV